jgi:hypothetical protein
MIASRQKNYYAFIFEVSLLPDNQKYRHKLPIFDDLNDPNQLCFKLSLMPHSNPYFWEQQRY